MPLKGNIGMAHPSVIPVFFFQPECSARPWYDISSISQSMQIALKNGCRNSAPGVLLLQIAIEGCFLSEKKQNYGHGTLFSE